MARRRSCPRSSVEVRAPQWRRHPRSPRPFPSSPPYNILPYSGSDARDAPCLCFYASQVAGRMSQGCRGNAGGQRGGNGREGGCGVGTVANVLRPCARETPQTQTKIRSRMLQRQRPPRPRRGDRGLGMISGVCPPVRRASF